MMNAKKYLVLAAVFLSNSAFAQTPCQQFVDTTPVQDLSGLTAKKQKETLWQRVLVEEYKTLPALTGKEHVLNIDPAKTHKELMELRLRAFEAKGDVRPVTDTKRTHIYGPAVLVKVVLKKTVFTGIFSEGEREALVRTSMAFNPKKSEGPHDFAQPGLAIKFFADHQASVNVLAMGSLDSEKSDGRFFSTDMATKLAEPKSLAGKVGQAIFSASTQHPGHLKLDHLANLNPNGSSVEAPVTPEWIVFVPTANAQAMTKKEAHDFRPDLLAIPAGTKIYTLFGMQKKADGSSVKIELGHVETTSRFVASLFADRKLHFRHQGAPATAGFQDYVRWQCGE